MAGYGNSSRRYSTHSPPSSDDWGRTSYASDHVCRPVIIDAEGRKRPIVSYGADQHAEHYVTKTETIVQRRVDSPFDSESEHQLDRRWSEDPYPKPLTLVNNRPRSVEEFITKVQTDASRRNAAPWDASHWSQTPKSTRDDGYTGGYGEHNDLYNKDSPKSGGHASHWRQTPKSTRDDGYTGGYGEHNDLYNKDSLKSGGHTYRNDDYDGYFRKQGNTLEPSTITSGRGGWGKPNHSTVTAAPNASLSGATNDINAAIGLLEKAAKPSVTSSPPTRYGGRGYTDNIDSREAAKRYGNYNFFSRPYNREDSYTPTIDSREAAKKYNGSTV